MITIKQVEPIMNEKIDGRVQLIVWHLCRDKLPAKLPADLSFDDWYEHQREHTYMCITASGDIQSLTWYNGWNCCPGYCRREIHDVIAWAEFENPFPEEVTP